MLTTVCSERGGANLLGPMASAKAIIAHACAAERELRTFLVLQFLKEHHLGKELPGVVTGFVPSGNGYFVTLDK